MEMNSPDREVKLQSSHCEIIMRLKWFFFFFLTGGELSIHWHRAVLDFRCPHVNIETARRRTRWCYESGGSCVPWRGFHMCLTGRRKIPPQISPVCNPAVERQTQRRFLELKATVLFLSVWNFTHDFVRNIYLTDQIFIPAVLGLADPAPHLPKQGQN